jgi:hypothetical protein
VQSAVDASRALYYPHAQFGSAAWVKSTLLYWEGIVRTQVSATEPVDDDEIRELVDAGLIEEIPFSAYNERVAEQYSERLEALLREHGGRLPEGLPSLRGVRGVHPEKEPKMRAAIVELCDARGDRLAAEVTRTKPNETLALYASLLANEIARDRDLAPVTDEPIFDAVSTFFENERISSDARAVPEVDGHALAELALPMPSLEALKALPVKRLLEIREKYAPQRRRYREKVQARVAEIAKLDSVDALREHLKRFQDEIRDDMVGEREAVKDAKVNERWSLLGVSAPASVAAGLTIASASSAVVGVGAFALTMTSWFAQKRSNLGKEAGSHYLVALESEATRPLGQRVSDAFRKLVS